jgi:5-methylcytosine-specific restriction endonuclease McrA
VSLDRSEVTPIPKGPARKPARRKPLPWKSEKRRLEAGEREHVRLAVIRRDGGCVAIRRGAPGPCRSPWADRPELEVHEVKSRGRGGSYLDPGNCVAVCQSHHDWITEHPVEARDLGLLIHSWEGL